MPDGFTTRRAFWKVSDAFHARVGYRPDFISVINEQNERWAVDNVRLAKKMQVECKLNNAMCSGREGRPYQLSKIYQLYLQVIEEGLAPWEYNSKALADSLHGRATACPRHRRCGEEIRCLQPEGDYYSCGSFADDFDYPIDFAEEMSSERVQDPLQGDFSLSSLKAGMFWLSLVFPVQRLSQDHQGSQALFSGRFPLRFDEKFGSKASRTFRGFVKETIDLSINPTYGCNFRCSFCYLTEEQLGERRVLGLDILEQKLKEISTERLIRHADVYGGEIGLLEEDYLQDLLALVETLHIKRHQCSYQFERTASGIHRREIRFVGQLGWAFEAGQSQGFQSHSLSGAPGASLDAGLTPHAQMESFANSENGRTFQFRFQHCQLGNQTLFRQSGQPVARPLPRF